VRVPGLGQITWWIVCWQKMRGHLGIAKSHGSREIAVEWAVGVWVHRDNWLKAQMCPVLEPNTNAQRISLLSHLLRSAWHPLAKLLELPAQSPIGSPGTLHSVALLDVQFKDHFSFFLGLSATARSVEDEFRNGEKKCKSKPWIVGRF